MKQIDSPKNDTIKEIIKLKQTKYQNRQQQYLLEGRHEISEAIQSKAPIQQLLVTETQILPYLKYAADFELIQISAQVSQHLSATKTNQGVFAVMQITDTALPKQLSGAWLLLDDLQDPGNVGTMVRTADAAGFAGVILGEKTVSIYNDKVLRAMQGSQFHLPIYKGNLTEAVAQCQQQGLSVFGTALDPQAKNYQTVTPLKDFGLVIGNEGNGVRPEILAQTDENLYIPILGKAESLNAGVAAGILMFYLHQ
ncbi:TrmH family RNA methyltransferase [Agrilactobacillus yilanensis]|uniref:TrmH family RNA methyltransferase n=1 Tax=Agrilactobacillus yilanensis TaxID=2485997 RepID=A0ABW4JA29_9LACO|nr:RNA methyltransferase [Agrilactobacillus yilanensis]